MFVAVAPLESKAAEAKKSTVGWTHAKRDYTKDMKQTPNKQICSTKKTRFSLTLKLGEKKKDMMLPLTGSCSSRMHNPNSPCQQMSSSTLGRNCWAVLPLWVSKPIFLWVTFWEEVCCWERKDNKPAFRRHVRHITGEDKPSGAEQYCRPSWVSFTTYCCNPTHDCDAASLSIFIQLWNACTMTMSS